jgi:hypothetical protein
MLRRRMLSLSLIILVLALSAKAEKPFALTSDEQKAVIEAVQFQRNWQKNFEQSELAALNAPLKAQEAVEALGNFQKAFAMREVANARMDSLLSSHRLAHGCADCEYAPDWKSLIRKEVKP